MDLTKIRDYLIKSIGKNGVDLDTICEKLDLKNYELLGIIELLKQQGVLIDVIDNRIIRLPKPKEKNDIYEIPNNLEHLKLLLISDTHLCSNYDRIDILRYLYDKAEKNGVNYVLHSGDFTDGRSNRPEHVYELKEHSYQGQVDYCVAKYPQVDGINTYAIQGN